MRTEMHPNMLFVVANHSRARFVRATGHRFLYTEKTLNSHHATILADASTLGQPGPQGRDEAIVDRRHEYPHGLRDLELKAFAGQIAIYLAAELEKQAFEHLVLVGELRALHAVEVELDRDVAGHIVGLVRKDLTSIPDAELWQHLRPWV